MPHISPNRKFSTRCAVSGRRAPLPHIPARSALTRSQRLPDPARTPVFRFGTERSPPRFPSNALSHHDDAPHLPPFLRPTTTKSPRGCVRSAPPHVRSSAARKPPVTTTKTIGQISRNLPNWEPHHLDRRFLFYHRPRISSILFFSLLIGFILSLPLLLGNLDRHARA